MSEIFGIDLADALEMLVRDLRARPRTIAIDQIVINCPEGRFYLTSWEFLRQIILSNEEIPDDGEPWTGFDPQPPPPPDPLFHEGNVTFVRAWFWDAKAVEIQ